MRLLVRAIVGVCLLFLLTLSFVQVGQRILRHRAELLLMDVESEASDGSWAAAQRLMAKWGAFGHYEETCTPRHCEYQIELEDWPGQFQLSHKSSDYVFRSLTPALLRLHWHGAAFSANYTVAEGRITTFGTTLMTAVPSGAGPVARSYDRGEYSLIASSWSWEHPADDFFWPTVSSHPNHSVRAPDRCMDCLTIRTTFPLTASRTELTSLMNFNFSCITRWKPCTVEQDIFPEAWQQFEVDRELRKRTFDRYETCNFSAAEMTRGSPLVLRVLVTGKEDSTVANFYTVPVSIEEVLKGDTIWKIGKKMPLMIASRPKGIAARENIPQRTELILFVSDQAPEDITPPDCGTILATPQAVTEVRAAIAAGSSPQQ